MNNKVNTFLKRIGKHFWFSWKDVDFDFLQSNKTKEEKE